MTQTLSDEDIAKNVQNGDIHAYKELVDRYEQKMLRYAKKFLFGYQDAEDIVQDIFLKAYTNIQSFDTTRLFSPWLYRIAHNEFINSIKKTGREPLSFFDPDTLFPHPAAPGNASTELEKNEVREMLNTCLNKLDVKYREPLVLYYFEDMSYQKISEIMRIPVPTVGIRISRGKTALKTAYNTLHP